MAMPSASRSRPRRRASASTARRSLVPSTSTTPRSCIPPIRSGERRAQLQSGARDDETGLVRGDHGLSSVAKPELAQDVADVRLHRLVAEHEAVGDLVVRKTGCDQAENFDLAAGERFEVFGTG